jgi:hypothetical protein
MANGWGQGTWGAVGWSGIGNTSFAVTGVAGTTAVGDEGTTAGSLVIETGLQATGSIGTVTASSVHIITPTGVSGTTFVGSAIGSIPISVSVTGLEATIGFLSGWGSSAWDGGVWGGGVFADHGQILPITGVEATGQSNNPTVSGTSIFSVTGVQGVSGLGDEATTPQSKAFVTQSALTGSVGNTTETGGASFSPTGVSATALIAQTSTSTITFTVTVVGGNPSNHPYYNVGSANKFAINGSTATADVTLNLHETNTYRFDQSDASNDGHPLRLSATENGTHGGGSAYTTGVTTNGTPGQAGAYTEITVAAGAPDLHYYCTNHGNMGYFAYTPVIGPSLIGTTGAPVTTVVGTTAVGNETVTAGSDVAVTLAGLSISSGTLAIAAGSVLSLTGVSGTGATGEEQVYSLIKPDQLANWVEKAA